VAGVHALSGNPISWLESLDLFTDFEDFPDIAVAGTFWERRFLTGFSTLSIVVDFSSDTYGGVLIFDQQSIVWNLADFEWFHFNFANVGTEQSASVHFDSFQRIASVGVPDLTGIDGRFKQSEEIPAPDFLDVLFRQSHLEHALREENEF